MPSPRQTRRLFIHVGLQKTGTSYLQGVLLDNAAELADQGLDLVPRAKRQAFELMLVVRGRYDSRDDPASVSGALDRFGRELESAPGPDAVLSQESLAACQPDQIDRLLGACGEREVHCIVTARDLARGLPSSWQQQLKAGDTTTWAEWLDRLERDQAAVAAGRRRARHPWIHLDPVAVLQRWGERLPADRLHLVTVPPSGSSPSLLLERFCRVLDVDPSGLRPPERPANTSLGREQAELLRRVNSGLSDEMRKRQVYGDVGKRFLAASVLGAQQGRPIVVPPARREWCEAVAARQEREIVETGWDVVGDLADLRPRPDRFDQEDTGADEAEVARAAVDALVHILTLRGRAQMRRRAERAKENAGPPSRGRRLRRRLRGWTTARRRSPRR